MKKSILVIIGLLCCTMIHAQAPQGINHQAIIRDALGKLVTSKTIGIRVSILQGATDGTVIYVETHSPESNTNGLITYVIGKGTVLNGVFDEIDWSGGPYFLKTEVDPDGGTAYSIEGVTQLLSVPYALHAKTSEDAFKGDMKGAPITNLADPTGAQDAATKAYVDKLENRLDAIETSLIDAGLHPSKFRDTRDDNIYNYVTIGAQVWMAEDLKYLPSVVGPVTGSETVPYYYVYGYNGTDVNAAKATANYQNYGVLYNWPAAMNENASSSANPSGVQGVCPTGWHVPSHDEWTQLEQYICNQLVNSDCATKFPYNHTTAGWRGTNEGNALKSCRQVGSPLGGCNTSDHPRWNSHGSHHGTDAFDFSALPGGYRYADGSFYNIGSYGSWWSATEYSASTAWGRFMGYDYGSVNRDYYDKAFGFSLRCVRDN